MQRNLSIQQLSYKKHTFLIKQLPRCLHRSPTTGFENGIERITTSSSFVADIIPCRVREKCLYVHTCCYQPSHPLKGVKHFKKVKSVAIGILQGIKYIQS